MGSNPIIRFELIRAVRRRRHYVMRAAFGLFVLYVAWALYANWERSAANPGGWEWLRIRRNLPLIGDLAVLQLLWRRGSGSSSWCRV